MFINGYSVLYNNKINACALIGQLWFIVRVNPQKNCMSTDQNYYIKATDHK